MYENNDFYYEFQVKVLQTLSGLFCESFVGNSSVFSLEHSILSSYICSKFVYKIILIQGRAICVFYDGQIFFIYQTPDVFEINVILNSVSKHIIHIYLIRKIFAMESETIRETSISFTQNRSKL